MLSDDKLFRKVITGLVEREKELNCLYSVDELLHDTEQEPETMFEKLVLLLPPGWQYSTICEARILYKGRTFKTADFKETSWMQFTEIIVDGQIEGKIEVVYTEFIRLHGHTQFLPEELRLLSAIAERVSNFLLHRKIKNTLEYLHSQKRFLKPEEGISQNDKDEYWKWRMHMVEVIAESMDAGKFGIEKLFVIGSTKNATAGPSSDIDLIVYFTGNEKQQYLLNAWFEGWSLCLSEMNYIRTGYKTDGLIDLHIITNEDISNKSSYAVMIGSTENSAKEIRLKSQK
jgi:hypothetical protein